MTSQARTPLVRTLTLPIIVSMIILRIGISLLRKMFVRLDFCYLGLFCEILDGYVWVKIIIWGEGVGRVFGWFGRF